MKIIIEKKILPNGFIRISAIDEESGMEDYVIYKNIKFSQEVYVTNLAIKKLQRRLRSL